MRRTPRKRHGLLVALTILNWLLIGLMVYFTDPDVVRDLVIPGSYILMGSLLFSGFFLLLSIIFLSAKRSLRWTLGIMVFLYLRIFGLGNLLNAVLILGFLLSVEAYFILIKREKAVYSTNAVVDKETKQDFRESN